MEQGPEFYDKSKAHCHRHGFKVKIVVIFNVRVQSHVQSAIVFALPAVTIELDLCLVCASDMLVVSYTAPLMTRQVHVCEFPI